MWSRFSLRAETIQVRVFMQNTLLMQPQSLNEFFLNRNSSICAQIFKKLQKYIPIIYGIKINLYAKKTILSINRENYS